MHDTDYDLSSQFIDYQIARDLEQHRPRVRKAGRKAKAPVALAKPRWVVWTLRALCILVALMLLIAICT